MTSKWVGQRPGTTAGDGFHPRVELHIHLDGSIEPAALLPIAQRRKLVLPGIDAVPTSVEDIWTALLSMHPGWRIFDLVNEIIGGEEQTLVEIAEAFVDQQAARGWRTLRCAGIRCGRRCRTSPTCRSAWRRRYAPSSAG